MAENNRTNTSTQIRNLWSDGMAYLNMSFFNTNLLFKFYPFISKDNVGRSTYDMKNPQSTTVNFEGAYALWETCEDIKDGKIQECDLPIPCAAGASLNLKRQIGPNGPETFFSITKNNTTVTFKFNTMNIQVKENGQMVTKVIESGLGAFKKTIDGYLEGINADRHLDKLTEDYVKSLPNGGQQNNNGNNNNYRNNYNNNGGNNRYNGNNNYKKNYNNNGNYKNNNQNNQGGWNQNQQNMSTYQIPN